MSQDDSAGMAEQQARAVFLYPSGLARYTCGSDNDGYPTCMGDGSWCGYSRVLGYQVCKHLRPSED